MNVYATFRNCDAAENAALDLLDHGADEDSLRLACWQDGGFLSLLLPSGDIDAHRTRNIIQRHTPVMVGEDYRQLSQLRLQEYAGRVAPQLGD